MSPQRANGCEVLVSQVAGVSDVETSPGSTPDRRLACAGAAGASAQKITARMKRGRFTTDSPVLTLLEIAARGDHPFRWSEALERGIPGCARQARGPPDRFLCAQGE